MDFLKAMLAEMNANTKAMQGRINKMKDEIKDDTNANRKADKEKAHADLEHMQKMIRTNQERMEAKMVL
jgi:hypothetical protein